MAATGPKTATPPADAARGATADLCDVFIKEPVDLVRQHPVSIVQPIFRWLVHTYVASQMRLYMWIIGGCNFGAGVFVKPTPCAAVGTMAAT